MKLALFSTHWTALGPQGNVFNFTQEQKVIYMHYSAPVMDIYSTVGGQVFQPLNLSNHRMYLLTLNVKTED